MNKPACNGARGLLGHSRTSRILGLAFAGVFRRGQKPLLCGYGVCYHGNLEKEVYDIPSVCTF